MVMQAWLQMPGAGGQGYGQHNFRQGGGDMYGGGQGGGSREEASSEAGRCMVVKTAAVGPGTVEAAGPGIAAEQEARTTTASNNK
jgi:hypothetical protein